MCVLTPDADVDKLKLLLQLGVDKSCVDLNGNTLYHIAARHDQANVLHEFLGRFNFLIVLFNRISSIIMNSLCGQLWLFLLLFLLLLFLLLLLLLLLFLLLLVLLLLMKLS